MRTYSKLILAALAATAILALAVGSASAGRLRLSERNFELIWDNALPGKANYEFLDLFNGINIQCRLTMLGRWVETTIAKRPGIRQGTINHNEMSECEGGSVTIKNETLPWNIQYRSFSGTLPRITRISIELIGARYHIREPSGIECELGTEASHPAVGIFENGLESTGEPENITADRNARIPLRGSFPCALAGEGEFGGIGLFRNLPRTAKIRITLI